MCRKAEGFKFPYKYAIEGSLVQAFLLQNESRVVVILDGFLQAVFNLDTVDSHEYINMRAAANSCIMLCTACKICIDGSEAPRLLSLVFRN